MKNKLIEELYARDDIKQWCLKRCSSKSLADDLLQELFIVLYRIPDKKLKEINDKKEIDYFILGIIRNMTSSTGAFYRKYILPDKKITDHISYDEDGNESSLLDNLENDISDLVYEGKSKEVKHLYLEALEQVLDGDTIYPFDKRVLISKLKHGSNKNTAEAEKLNERFVHESVRRAKEKIKEGIQKKIE